MPWIVREARHALALKVFDGDEKNFGLAQKVAESLLESEQNERALALVSRLRIPMLDSGEHDAVTKLLNELAAKMPGRLEPLEWCRRARTWMVLPVCRDHLCPDKPAELCHGTHDVGLLARVFVALLGSSLVSFLFAACSRPKRTD